MFQDTIAQLLPSSAERAHLRKGIKESLFAGLACAFLLLIVFPDWFLHPQDHVIGPDRILPNTDLSNSLFMIQRQLLGESGCETRLFALPIGSSVCSDVPNPLYTSIVGWWAAFLGVAWAFNWSSLVLLSVNGACFYAVARLLGAVRISALWGALLVALCPTVLSEVAFGRPVSAIWGPALLGAGLLVYALREQGALRVTLLGAGILGLACLFSPVTVLLIVPWVAVEALWTGWEAERKGRWIAQVLKLLFWVSIVVLPVALAQGRASPTRFLGEGWWGSHLGFGQVCITGAEIPSLHPWNEGRLSPLVGAGSFIPALFLFSGAFFGEARRSWLPVFAGASLLVLVGLGPCLGGDSPLALSPIRVLSENLSVFKLVPVWRFWAAASLLMTLALVLALSTFFLRLEKVHRNLLHAVMLVVLVLSCRWSMQHTEENTVDWPAHPQLETLLEEPVLLDLPLVNDKVVVQTHVADLPVPRLNPERHEREQWRQAVGQAGFSLLLAADALQSGEPWRHILMTEDFSQRKSGPLGLRRVLLYPAAVETGRMEEWLAFLSTIGASLEIETEEIEVYRID